MNNKNFASSFSKKFSSLLPYVVLVLSLILVGCAGFKTNNSQEFNLITTTRTPLSKTGPLQTTPDTYLEEGTRIRMLRMEGEYALVETTYGLQGYIEASVVKSAPQEQPQSQY
ncbi:MAG: hypothetical protein V4507_09785 [Verrucomicrobiota bacterium]